MLVAMLERRVAAGRIRLAMDSCSRAYTIARLDQIAKEGRKPGAVRSDSGRRREGLVRRQRTGSSTILCDQYHRQM